MSIIDTIMKNEASSWVNNQINDLPERAKFRASSSLRSLQWANGIMDAEMPIPACFCALHATEEAVAAFVSCAKECGYDEAKAINIKDHAAKATVSVVAQKISNILTPYNVAVAVDPTTASLIARYEVDGTTHHNEASTKLFHFRDADENVRPDFFDELIEMFGDIDQLKEAVRVGQEARNTIFYATSTGYPTGFDEPDESLRRECQISLGLIWASLDMARNRDETIPFIEQALQTVCTVIAELKKK